MPIFSVVFLLLLCANPRHSSPFINTQSLLKLDARYGYLRIPLSLSLFHSRKRSREFVLLYFPVAEDDQIFALEPQSQSVSHFHRVYLVSLPQVPPQHNYYYLLNNSSKYGFYCLSVSTTPPLCAYTPS